MVNWFDWYPVVDTDNDEGNKVAIRWFATREEAEAFRMEYINRTNADADKVFVGDAWECRENAPTMHII